MKLPRGIAYGPVIAWSTVLGVTSLVFGWILARGLYPLTLICVPVMGLAFLRILHCYGDSVRRVTFMFNAIDSDDLTFRFNEDPSTVDNTMLNTALNRIREILTRTKLRAEERERYYQLIMESAQTGLITVNDTGSVYQANGEALRIFGLPRLNHIRQLEESAPEVARALAAIRPGEKLRVTCSTETGEMALTLGCSEITLEDRHRRVISVSDINSEVSEIQIESWSKLSRILTHEIMNSLAPVTSLSDTLLHIDRPLDPDVRQGLETISATSRRLVTFVEGYRRFTRIPAPQREPFEVRELIRQAAPEQVAAAPSKLLCAAAYARDLPMLTELLRKGLQPGDHAAPLLLPLLTAYDGQRVAHLLKDGLRVRPEDYDAMNVCLREHAPAAAEALLGQGMKLDGYLTWAAERGTMLDNRAREILEELKLQQDQAHSVQQQGSGPVLGGLSL